MKRYKEYKDSGIEWIGEIPQNWEILKLKYLANIQNSNVDKKSFENEIKVRLCNYVDVYKNLYINPSLDLMEATATQDEIDKFLLQVGDVLITKDSEEWNDIAIPAYVEKSAKDMVCGYHLSHLRPMEKVLFGKYLFFAFMAHNLHSQFEIAATGVTRYGIPKSAIDNAIITVPPFNEQVKIAGFVEKNLFRTEDLLKSKQKMIDLLKEERAAVINHAVTKGINPNAELKDSGIEWLGEIPKHWKVKKLKFAVSLRSGDSITSDSIKSEGTYPVYGGNGLRGYTEKYTHEGEFVLIGRQGALCGNINYAQGLFWASEHAVVATPLEQIDTSYIGELLRIMNLNQYSVSAAQPGLSVERIQNLHIPFPPYDEQAAISKTLKKALKKLKGSEDMIVKEISLIEEYRTALINEAVTGKICVSDEVV